MFNILNDAGLKLLPFNGPNPVVLALWKLGLQLVSIQIDESFPKKIEY